jgi:NAD(P)-dependent dehydrogenase (short-subunit alcohol dehydrogenase family)
MRGLEGRHVVVTGGAGALGQAVTRRLADAGAECHVPRIEDVDLTSEAAVVAYYGALPRLWASIHLAGGFAAGKLEAVSLADFRAQHDMNAVTCFLCCREAARLLRAGGGGRIVNVAARPAVTPSAGAGMVAYTASKAAVAALTGALAKELEDDGILVNAVVPSIMDTPANRRAMPDADHARWPKTDEVAAAIAFLVSPDNALTSGALVPVYGRM